MNIESLEDCPRCAGSGRWHGGAPCRLCAGSGTVHEDAAGEYLFSYERERLEAGVGREDGA